MKILLSLSLLLFVQTAAAEKCFDQANNVLITIAHDGQEIWAIEIRENNKVVLLDRGNEQFGFTSVFCKAPGVEHIGAKTRLNTCHSHSSQAGPRILEVLDGPRYDLSTFECFGEPIE
jgi:hypothetical protein